MTVSSSSIRHADMAAGQGRPKAWLRSLSLGGFRTYRQLDVEFDERPVVLTGPNGAGKTNLLEAVSLLAPGKGLRGADLRVMAQSDRGAELLAVAPYLWTILAELTIDGHSHRIGTGAELTQSGQCRRQLKIDGELCASIARLGQFVRLAWLTPAHDRLFVDGKSKRRQFLDRLALSHDPNHAGRVAAYEKAQRERQKLLKDGYNDDTWLKVLEARMAEQGVAIAAARVDLVGGLRGIFDMRKSSAFPTAELALEGMVEVALCEGRSATDAEDELSDALRRNRRRDSETGRTSSGPHRSDLAVRHVEKDMPAHLCSTGEQKSLLIGIFLANAQLLKRQDLSAAPLLLLDEVAAHLDDDRRHALFDEICALGCQTWMTGTDRSLFDAIAGRSQNLVVDDSRIRRL